MGKLIQDNIIGMLDTFSCCRTYPAANPGDIPCNETSNGQLLCENPVVSVGIITYNQCEYISSAIEGALNQRTDFKYEIVIGDDCSTDGTREICLDYQRRFPDKIRFLWSDENVHRYNGNFKRVTYRCRGEFIALCEGDDYWVDPLKLQKQVDLLRKTDAVACVAFNDIAYADGKVEHSKYKPVEFLYHEDLQAHYFHTNTFVLRRSVYERMLRDYHQIPIWYSMMILFCFSGYGKIALLPEIVSVYRITMKGVATAHRPRDSHFLSLYAYVPLWAYGPRSHRGWYAFAALNQLVMLLRYVDADSLMWFSGIRGVFCKLFCTMFFSSGLGIKYRAIMFGRVSRAWLFRSCRFVPAFRARCFTNQHNVFH